MKDQFEIALPAGWSVYDQAPVVGAVPGKGGPPVVFSSEVIDGKAIASGDREALRKVLSQMSGVEVGSIPGFMLDRLPARKGMSCKGFDKSAEKQLLDLLGKGLSGNNNLYFRSASGTVRWWIWPPCERSMRPCRPC